MKATGNHPYIVTSISELHRLLALPKPEHPLISVINFNDIKCYADKSLERIVYQFYSICIKKDFKGKMKYGQNDYDFDDGIMTFLSPGQVISTEITDDMALSGWWLVIHPDFIRHYPLSKNIKAYGFFSYAVNEALHLSEKEETMIASVMQHIEQEYCSVIDSYSQDVMIAHIELLLNYSNRFYNRQFITRKHINNNVLVQLEELLTDYFNRENVEGLPTVQYLSAKLHISPGYLSDMLRTLTGQTAQQHIHHTLIEKAKETLAATSLSVSEIAYRLGFEHPQSFNKLFKNKTSLSPLEFRHRFN